ncbi:flocculation protein FLO11-like [Lactuca sativa]|uniref:flocculation protein FLO11-like n=1 Tax=Lactuca sativa TaxID=4236 RepID=UPI0022AF91C0|nr:flocculation protein FLO11-like [Lactuca sativa]
MKKVQRSESALGEIFPESGKVSVRISKLFEEYIQLFDEPEKAKHSEAKAVDKKIDNLKKIIDEAAKEMESEPPKPTVGQSSNDSPNNDSMFKGETSLAPKTTEMSFEGENPILSPTHKGPSEGEHTTPNPPNNSQIEGEIPTPTEDENSDPDTSYTSLVEGEKENKNDEDDQSELEEEVNVELDPAYDPNYPPLVKWTKDHPKTQIIGESSEKIPVMKDAIVASVATFHTKKIIIYDPTKFPHNESIPETVYSYVSAESKVLAEYRKIPPKKLRVLSSDQQATLDAMEKPGNQGKRATTMKGTTEDDKSKSRKRKYEKGDSSNPKKIKKMAKKSKSPSPSRSENDEEDEEEEIHHVSPRGNIPPRSPTPTESLHVKLPTPPPSPKRTVLILVAPAPPPTTSQTTTSIPPPPPVTTIPISTTPIPPHIISQSTSTTIPEPTVGVNPDKLLHANKSYIVVVLKAFLDTALEQYTESIEKSTKAANESTSSCKKATTDVVEIVHSTQIFLESLKGHVETSTTKVNASVDSLSKSLQAEKTMFEAVRSSIQAENTSLISSVNSRLESLHADLAKESQASIIEVQKVQLAQAEKEISLLKTERAVFRSCVEDVKDMLTSILGAHDPILTLTIRNHLTSKILPALALLHEMKGVSERLISPKQGGEGSQLKVIVKTETESPQPKVKVTTEPKGNEASSSGSQDKKKGIDDDSDDEEEDTIAEALKRKKNRELDETLKIAREAEEWERRNKEEKEALNYKKALFPLWTKETLINEAIEFPSIY